MKAWAVRRRVPEERWNDEFLRQCKATLQNISPGEEESSERVEMEEEEEETEQDE